jgi:hypothetical protein
MTREEQRLLYIAEILERTLEHGTLDDDSRNDIEAAYSLAIDGPRNLEEAV